MKIHPRISPKKSLPARGEWIEIIGVEKCLASFFASLPARGEWIEINPERP